MRRHPLDFIVLRNSRHLSNPALRLPEGLAYWRVCWWNGLWQGFAFGWRPLRRLERRRRAEVFVALARSVAAGEVTNADLGL